ncbi:hypothetical protein K458DRAFT_211558 [Lentithecium fluviatile CBS 122367]|uniref:Uncharacterized protein n=1 Tax=Lentithecium fluviatile CBS 122367 TaxID=1168545 RepID=A0A6G1J786_9PLEO|nr:hypothetical protein K458DRAFT_211558 [Lentithecium fluviatile CBS 122367]
MAWQRGIESGFVAVKISIPLQHATRGISPFSERGYGGRREEDVALFLFKFFRFLFTALGIGSWVVGVVGVLAGIGTKTLNELWMSMR